MNIFEKKKPQYLINSQFTYLVDAIASNRRPRLLSYLLYFFMLSIFQDIPSLTRCLTDYFNASPTYILTDLLTTLPPECHAI